MIDNFLKQLIFRLNLYDQKIFKYFKYLII